MLVSIKWLRWFLIEVVVDGNDIVDSDNSLLIRIFYVGTMRERVEENLCTSYTCQELSNHFGNNIIDQF